MFQRLQWLGQRVYASVEAVGETVVAILGLDDSRYQDILDDMTPREAQMALHVHEQREAEYQALAQARASASLEEARTESGAAPCSSLTGAAPVSMSGSSVAAELGEQAGVSARDVVVDVHSVHASSIRSAEAPADDAYAPSSANANVAPPPSSSEHPLPLGGVPVAVSAVPAVPVPTPE
eukprot:gene31196-37703_t